jgi:hypothetical protein
MRADRQSARHQHGGAQQQSRTSVYRAGMAIGKRRMREYVLNQEQQEYEFLLQ